MLCYLIVRPYAEMGIDDEWTYVKSAEVLAQTGHIVYNGWATPMLGWQLYFGALFVKLFGFSFTTVRLKGTFVEAVATAFLLQRTMVLAGVNERNATLATMAFILSPLYLPLAFTFMTDVPGFFCIVLCLYMCLRALEAKSQNSAVAWIVLAALLDAVGGTVRQIAWLGVLVMVPSTLWLLRRDCCVLATGAMSCIAGAGIVFAAMRWFARQPFSIPLSLTPQVFNLLFVKFLGSVAIVAGGCLSMLLIPVLLMFAGAFRNWNRRTAALFAAGSLCFALCGTALFITDKLDKYLAPFPMSVSYMMRPALQSLNLIAAPGGRPEIAGDGLWFAAHGADGDRLWGLCLLPSWQAAGVLGRSCERSRHLVAGAGRRARPVPLIAYIALLTWGAYQAFFFDRYLLPLLAICLLALMRYYQQNVRADLPWACVFLVAIFAGFSIAGTHDEFSMYRGYATAVSELRSSGVPATAIWGPWEFDGWTEVEKSRILQRLQNPRPVRGLRAAAGAGSPP